MAKNPLAHARAQFAFHMDKAEKWKQYIALHEELHGDAPAAAPAPAEKKSRAPARSGAIADTRYAAHLILEEARTYVPVATMLTGLAEMGVEVGGANPGSTLSARLSGDAEIESRRGFGYRLKKFGNMERAAGSPDSEAPAALSAPDSADEDGREVAHENMNH